jgi:hypothetical protein
VKQGLDELETWCTVAKPEVNKWKNDYITDVTFILHPFKVLYLEIPNMEQIAPV